LRRRVGARLGTQAGNFLVTPRSWSGTVPAGFAQIEAPTPYVWIIGRTKTDGPADYDAVHKIQTGYKITPLSDWGKAPKPVEVKIDPSVDMKTPPKAQVDTMQAEHAWVWARQSLPESQSGHVVDSDARPPSQLTKGESGSLAPHFRGETCLNRAPER
jgi:hypothetical protein